MNQKDIEARDTAWKKWMMGARLPSILAHGRSDQPNPDFNTGFDAALAYSRGEWVAVEDRLNETIKCLSGEVSGLRKVLKECRTKWDTADNGMCAVCRTGHRLFDLKGNVQSCENAECLSHRIKAALSYGDPCDLCGKEMKATDKTERMENAIFGVCSACLRQQQPVPLDAESET